MVSIIPGIEARAGTNGNQQRIVQIAELLPLISSIFLTPSMT